MPSPMPAPAPVTTTTWLVKSKAAAALNASSSCEAPAPRASMDAAAAVDQQRLAGHERAVVRGQIDQRADEVGRHLRATEHPRVDVGLLALLGDVLLVVAAQREAGRDRVDADAVRSQLAGERAREAHHATLRRRVVDVVRDALEEGAGGDVDDLAFALRLHR